MRYRVPPLRHPFFLNLALQLRGRHVFPDSAVYSDTPATGGYSYSSITTFYSARVPAASSHRLPATIYASGIRNTRTREAAVDAAATAGTDVRESEKW